MLAHCQHDKKNLQDVDGGHRLQLWRETLHVEQAAMNEHHSDPTHGELDVSLTTPQCKRPTYYESHMWLDSLIDQI